MPNGTTAIEEIDALLDSMEQSRKKGKLSSLQALNEALDEIDPPAGQTPIPKPPPFAGGGVTPPEEPGLVSKALGGLGGLLTPSEEEEQVPVTGLAPVEELQKTFREQRPPVEQAAPLKIPFLTELKKQAPKAAQIQAGISTAISKPATEEQKQRLREIRDDADRLLDQIGQMAAIEQETVQQVLGVPSGPRFAGPKVSGKKARDVQLLDIARKFLLRTKTLDPDDTGFVAAVRRKVGEPARLLPFISSILEASELSGVLEAARKEQKGEKLTEIEELLLDSFANYASAEEAFKPGLLDEATAGAIGITTFATEFIATTPLFALGRRSATKLLLEVVKRRVRAKIGAEAAQRVAERAVKRVPAKLAAGFVGGVAQAVGLPQTIPETVRRQIPKLGLAASKEGVEALQRIDRGPGEKFGTALTKAFGLTVVESVTERTGGVVQKPLNFLSRKMRGFTKGRFFDLWMKGRGLSKVDETTKRIAEAAAWNGIVGEVFEEQVAKPFRNIIEGDPLFTGFTREQFAIEVLSFAMFGSLAKGMGFSARAVERVAQARGEKPPTLAKPKVEALPKPAPVSAEEAAELGVEPGRVAEVRKRRAEFEGPTEAAKRREPPKKPTLIVKEEELLTVAEVTQLALKRTGGVPQLAAEAIKQKEKFDRGELGGLSPVNFLETAGKVSIQLMVKEGRGVDATVTQVTGEDLGRFQEISKLPRKQAKPKEKALLEEILEKVAGVREQPGAAVAGAAEEREPTRVPAPAAPGEKKVAVPKEPTPAAPAPKKIRLRDNVQFTTGAGVQVVGVVERISGEILSIRDQESGKIVTASSKNVVLAGVGVTAEEVRRAEREKKEATERESRAERQAIIQAEFTRTKFETKTVELRMAKGKPPVSITGASIGGLIVHQRQGAFGKKGSIVSHIASGLSIWPQFVESVPLRDARIAMMRLSKLTDWTKGEKEVLANKEVKKRAGEWAKLLEEDLFAALPGEKLAAVPKAAPVPELKVSRARELPPELPKGEKLPADFAVLEEASRRKTFIEPSVAKRLVVGGFIKLGKKVGKLETPILTEKGQEAAERSRASRLATEAAEERAETRKKAKEAIQLQADPSLPPDKYFKAALEPIREEYIRAFGGLDNYKAAARFPQSPAGMPEKYRGKVFRIKIPGTRFEHLIASTPHSLERAFKKGPAALKPFAPPRRVPFAPRKVSLTDREELVRSLQSEVTELIRDAAEDDVVAAAEENLEEARRLLKEAAEPKKAGAAGAVEGLRVPFARPPRREAAGRLKEIRQKMKSGVASKSEVIESVRIQGTPGGADTLQGEMHPLGFRPEQALEKLPESIQLQVQPTQTKAKKDLLAQVTELLDVPIRVGNFRERTARAIFKRKPEVIRERMAEDVRARIHEIGHAINKILWGVTPFGTLNWRPLAPFRKELKGIATPARPGASPLPEGFAEFVALWVVEPSIVKAKTPKFLAFWEKELSSPDPFIVKLRASLIDAQDNVRIWRTATPRARLRAHINRDERNTRRLTADDLYTMYVDRLDPINRAVKGMAQRAGEPEPPTEEHAYAIARLNAGWAGKANYFVRTRTFDRKTRRDTGESLADVLRDVGTKDLENFYDYLVAKRVIEKTAQGIQTGIDLQDSKDVVKELESPEFLKFKERRLRWSREVLRYGEGVLYTPDTRAQMEKMNQDYVPFFRVMEKEIAAGLGDTFTNLWNPVKRMKGSGRQIVDPAESDIKNAFTIINLTERARVLQALVAQAAKTDGAGRWVEGPIPAPSKPTTFELSEIKKSLEEAGFDVSDADLEVVATVFRPSSFKPNEPYIAPVLMPDGKHKWFRFDPDLFQAVSGLDHSGAGALIRLLGAPITKVITAPARILRTGATSLGPEFMVTNPQRDTVTAFIQSEYGVLPVIDTVRGAFHVVKRSELFNEYVKGGGEFAAIAGLDRKNVVATIRDLTETGIFKQIIRHPIESARAFSDTMEKATRMGEFIRARGKGATIPTATLAGRDVTLDFAKGGSKTFALNQLIAFFRAQINGMDVMLRKFKNNPTRTALRATFIVTLPSFLLYLVNRDDEEYKLQPRWIKDFFWLIPTGNPNVPFVPIRKPFVYGQIFGSIPERIWEWIDTRDPRAFDQILESIFNSGFPELIPTFATPLIEWIANKNLFTDRPLVPQGREKVAPELRVKPFTTETVKVFAKTPKLVGLEAVSPAKLENLITSYTAGLGRAVLQASDEVLRRVRGLPELPTRLPGELPFIRAFAVRPAGLNAEPIKIFFDRLEEMEQHRGTAQLVLKGERVPKQFVRTAIQQEETLGEFRKVRRQVGEIRTMMGLIRQAPNITGDKKREMIRRLERAAIALTIDVQTRFPERPTKVQPKKPRVPFTQSGRQQ
jgi:hypothetical protein